MTGFCVECDAGEFERPLAVDHHFGGSMITTFLRLLVTYVLVGQLLGIASRDSRMAAHADTVELSGGGHVAGEVRRASDAKPPYVVVNVDAELRVALPESRVRRIVTGDTLAEYRRRAQIAGNDAELNYMLARWCSANHLSGQNRYHLQRAVELDPEHAYARAALGYVKDQNQWVKHSELQRSRGMVQVKGKWQLPEAVAIRQSEDDSDLAAKLWIRDVSRLRKAALGTGDSAAQAVAELAAIEDPFAASAIAQELYDSRTGKSVQPRAMREMWIKLLGRFKNLTAVRALVQAGVEETDTVIREAAMDQLLIYGAPSAIATYMPMLKSESKVDVQRAARALSYFPPDPELALTLVESLVTEHKYVSAPSGQTQAAFGSDGSSSFGSGGKPTVRKEYIENRGVLNLVKMIEPNIDYGFNETKWLNHFGSKKSAYDGDLRRDP